MTDTTPMGEEVQPEVTTPMGEEVQPEVTTPMGEEVQPEVNSLGRYRCPWTKWEYPNGVNFAFRSTMPVYVGGWADQSKVPSDKELDTKLPVQDPDFDKLRNIPASGVQATWIGHATVLVQLDGINLLTDPVFSDYTGPLGIGYKRYRRPACSVKQLPPIDAVIISHNHHDHLDSQSVQSLNERFGKKLVWYVPKGVKTWMESRNCRNVVELSWWEEHTHCIEKEEKVTFALTPAQHWSGRHLIDTNKSLWGSWAVKGPRHSFFFAGDTGYCNAFKQIGHKYGPFDLSAIPIGAYYPRHFMGPQHVDPKQAVDIHLDIKSKNSLGIHWGTFKLTKEYYLEPKEELEKEVKKAGLSENSFVTINHGETKMFGGTETNS